MKKRNKYIAITFLLTIILSLIIFTHKATYYQGVNYHVRQVEIPLYVKTIDFFSRHYHYKELARDIVRGCKGEEEKVFAIFGWTKENIRRVPEGFPVVDDHIWNIIVRGYGTPDQSSDVFTTLCNYTGIPAFFSFIRPQGQGKMICLSFVKMKGRWIVFDPYRGVYFKDNKGGLADIKTVKLGNYSLNRTTDLINTGYYAEFITYLPSVDNMGLMRADIQSPLKRLIYEIKKIGHR